MQQKIMSVFYGNDRLPYKDAQRTVHYPIANGDLFCGANNTTQIRFYVDQIGGTSNVQWVATSKLPNGQIGNKVLSSPKYDEELGEHYLELDLSSYYTSIKGDVYIALNGYQGGVNIEEDEDTGIWSISGTPTIQATGSIKLGINYAPQTIPGTHFGVSDLQQILGALSEKISNINGIIVVDNITQEDLSGYELGQIFLDKNTGNFYRKSGLSYVNYDVPNVVDLTNTTSGTLTSKQLEIVKRPDALVKTTNGLCRKIQTGDDLVQMFVSLPVIGTTSTNVRFLNYVIVSIFNGNYSITTETYDFYTKSQIDDLLANNYIVTVPHFHEDGATGTFSASDLTKLANPNTIIVVEPSGLYTRKVFIRAQGNYFREISTGNYINNQLQYNTSYIFYNSSNGNWEYHFRIAILYDYTYMANNYYTKTQGDNRYDIQSLVSLGSGSSGTLSSANLEKVQRPNAVILKNYNFYYRIWSHTNSLTFESRYVVSMGSTQRLEIGKIVIDTTTGAWTYSNTSSFSVYTTSGVDNIVSTLKANSFQVVASLPATGQEGIIYLVETSSGSGVYNQYIWESGSYISLGTTQIDLSGYVQKTTSANKVYGTDGSGNQTTLPVDDFYEGNIARRDSDNSITVPLTPTQNGHASSKKYVDDSFVFATNSEIDALFE